MFYNNSSYLNIFTVGNVGFLGQTRNYKLKKTAPTKMIDNSPGIYTTYKPFLQKDKNIIKKLNTGISSNRPNEAQTALLRRHLLELTQSFMIPLERYIASLMPLQKSISPFKVSSVGNHYLRLEEHLHPHFRLYFSVYFELE